MCPVALMVNPALEQEDELVKKKGGTSVVWNWFGFKISDPDQITTLCKLCRRFVFVKGGNTTNLFNHLKNIHVREYEQCTRMRETVSPGACLKRSQARLNNQLYNHLLPVFAMRRRAKNG